jgi:hypothetical protein
MGIPGTNEKKIFRAGVSNSVTGFSFWGGNLEDY